ncbi:MAG: hypothetical protein IIC83_04050 [Chloroflexi bacterium]|nr:hypothetical protein [Chloroflexota bacterium]
MVSARGSSQHDELRNLLLQKIRQDYKENSLETRAQINDLTARTSRRQARVFLSIYGEIAQLIPPTAVRTRQTKYSSTGWSVGLLYYANPIVKYSRTNGEVLAVLIPEKGPQDSLEFWISGVPNDESGRSEITNHPRRDVIVRRAIQTADDDLIAWSVDMFRHGYEQANEFIGI